MTEAEKILVIGASWVGDMVMSQSLFMTLKRERPDAVIDVLAPEWSLPLLQRMPQVRRAIAMPVGHGGLQFGVRRSLGHSLRPEAYDQAIVLPNSLKSALVPWHAKAPKRTGWKGEMRYGLLNDLRRLDKSALPLMLDRFNALAFERGRIRAAGDFPAPHPVPDLVVQPEEIALAREKFGILDKAPVLALCPGAEFGASKRWPEARYAEVAAEKLKSGWQVWLFGSGNDAPVCDTIRGELDANLRSGCHNLAGRTSLAEAMDLLSCADAVVSNDSGLMHVAAALDRRLVVVYGSTSPDFTPPLNRQHRIVRLGLECSPCFQRECPLHHLNCLRGLPASPVIAALKELDQAA